MIQNGHTERLPFGIVNPGRSSHVLEAPAVDIPVKPVALTFVHLRGAVSLVTSIGAACNIRLRSPFDITADQKIEIPIPVVIDEGRAAAESAIRKPHRLRDVFEGSVSAVTVQAVFIKPGNEKVRMPVVVEVSHGGSHAVKRRVQSGSSGHILEMPAIQVAVKNAGGRSRPVTEQWGSVD